MISLRKKAETATEITLEWDPVPGAQGYRFSSEGNPKRSHTWDGTRTTVKFAKADWYKVEALGIEDSGTYDPSEPPPPPPPPPPTGLRCAPYSQSAAWPSAVRARLGVITGTSVEVSNASGLRSALAGSAKVIVLADGAYGRGENHFPVGRSVYLRAKNPLKAKLETSVKISGSNVRVEGIEIDGSSRSDTNGFEVSGADVEINGCHVHDILIGGIYAVGIFAFSGTQRLTVLNTIFERCGDLNTTAHNYPEAEHCMYVNGDDHVYLNLALLEPTGFGIQMYPKLFNSVMAHCTHVGSKLKSGFIQAGDSSGNKLVNGISVRNKSYGYEKSSGALVASHLIANGNQGGQFDGMSGATLLTSDPKLDAGLRPQAGSPAIGHVDAGFVPAVDILGRPRKGAGSAAGAWEPA